MARLNHWLAKDWLFKDYSYLLKVTKEVIKNHAVTLWEGKNY